jgi:hypothetical protein
MQSASKFTSTNFTENKSTNVDRSDVILRANMCNGFSSNLATLDNADVSEKCHMKTPIHKWKQRRTDALLWNGLFFGVAVALSRKNNIDSTSEEYEPTNNQCDKGN